MHWTFLVFLFAFTTMAFLADGFVSALALLAFLILVFACVLLHEFGHITVARLFGIQTPEVILLPLGGLAKLERIPSEPQHELAISIAGPMVNFVLFFGFVLVMGKWPDLDSISRLELGEVSLLEQLAVFNLAIGLFNLLPAFPMDGGRIFRALLALVQPRHRATHIAARISQGISVLLVMLGIFGGNLILALIGIFIFLAAGSEERLDLVRHAIGGTPVGNVMVTGQPQLAMFDPILDAADVVVHSDCEEFPVLDQNGKMIGILVRQDLLETLARFGPAATVGQAMRSSLPLVHPQFRAEQAADLIERGAPAVGVVDDGGRFLGIVNWRNLLDVLAIKQALGRSRRHPERSRLT